MTLVPDASHQNDEVLLVIESPQLAAHFTREMDRLWRGRSWASTHAWQESWGKPQALRQGDCAGLGGDWLEWLELALRETRMSTGSRLGTTKSRLLCNSRIKTG